MVHGEKGLPPAGAAPAMRRPGSRQPLGREFILAAALEIIDTQGVAALTMRALATQLQSGTATLYRHFANRTALIEAVIDNVVSEVDLTTPMALSGPWHQACKSLAQQLFDALAAHPNLAPLLSLFPPAGTAGAVRRERFLAILLRDGFPPDVALRIYTSVGHYVVGFAVQIGAHLITSEPGAGSPIALPDLDPASYPATATIAAAGARPATLAEEFTYGLDLIFAGIERTEKVRKEFSAGVR